MTQECRLSAVESFFFFCLCAIIFSKLRAKNVVYSPTLTFYKLYNMFRNIVLFHNPLQHIPRLHIASKDVESSQGNFWTNNSSPAPMRPMWQKPDNSSWIYFFFLISLYVACIPSFANTSFYKVQPEKEERDGRQREQTHQLIKYLQPDELTI